jgi:hypothetical protein
MAMLAWNTTLIPEQQRKEWLADALETLPADARLDFLAIVAEMMLRKEAHFASHRRFLLDYELTMTPNGPHLSVISTCL